MASEKVTAILEEIKTLTVLDLSELVHAIEDESACPPPPLWLSPLLPPPAVLLLPLRRRLSSTSFWLRSALRRSRSSRLCVRSPAWAWPRPRLW